MEAPILGFKYQNCYYAVNESTLQNFANTANIANADAKASTCSFKILGAQREEAAKAPTEVTAVPRNLSATEILGNFFSRRYIHLDNLEGLQGEQKSTWGRVCDFFNRHFVIRNVTLRDRKVAFYVDKESITATESASSVRNAQTSTPRRQVLSPSLPPNVRADLENFMSQRAKYNLERSLSVEQEKLAAAPQMQGKNPREVWVVFITDKLKKLSPENKDELIEIFTALGLMASDGKKIAGGDDLLPASEEVFRALEPADKAMIIQTLEEIDRNITDDEARGDIGYAATTLQTGLAASQMPKSTE